MTYLKPDGTEKARLRKVNDIWLKGWDRSDTYGGIREISVLEPLPGEVGFLRVVSMSVQPSPLSPQFPVRGHQDVTVHRTEIGAPLSASSYRGAQVDKSMTMMGVVRDRRTRWLRSMGRWW